MLVVQFIYFINFFLLSPPFGILYCLRSVTDYDVGGCFRFLNSAMIGVKAASEGERAIEGERERWKVSRTLSIRHDIWKGSFYQPKLSHPFLKMRIYIFCCLLKDLIVNRSFKLFPSLSLTHSSFLLMALNMYIYAILVISIIIFFFAFFFFFLSQASRTWLR